jgi:hypothetical protein
MSQHIRRIVEDDAAPRRRQLVFGKSSRQHADRGNASSAGSLRLANQPQAIANLASRSCGGAH